MDTFGIDAYAFRQQTGTDFAMLRGFRYGTYVREGDITLADLYSYLSAGAKLATGEVTGKQILQLLERTINGSLKPDPFSWGGVWLNGFSNITFDVDPSQPFGRRASNATIGGNPIDPDASYTVSGYFFDLMPDRVGGFRHARNVKVIDHPNGSVKDPTEFVADYLKTTTADPTMGRVQLLGSFPPPVFGNPEIQALRGAVAR